MRENFSDDILERYNIVQKDGMAEVCFLEKLENDGLLEDTVIIAYTAAIHFILTGITNIKSTLASGKVAAYARNMDILM